MNDPGVDLVAAVVLEPVKRDANTAGHALEVVPQRLGADRDAVWDARMVDDGQDVEHLRVGRGDRVVAALGQVRRRRARGPLGSGCGGGVRNGCGGRAAIRRWDRQPSLAVPDPLPVWRNLRRAEADAHEGSTLLQCAFWALMAAASGLRARPK